MERDGHKFPIISLRGDTLKVEAMEYLGNLEGETSWFSRVRLEYRTSGTLIWRLRIECRYWSVGSRGPSSGIYVHSFMAWQWFPFLSFSHLSKLIKKTIFLFLQACRRLGEYRCSVIHTPPPTPHPRLC